MGARTNPRPRRSTVATPPATGSRETERRLLRGVAESDRRDTSTLTNPGAHRRPYRRQQEAKLDS